MSGRRALLIVDHGSRQPEANAVVSEIARMTRRLRPELIVEYAHMEIAEPTLKQGVASCVAAGAQEIIVHPYLLADGRHSRETIPEEVERVAASHPEIRFKITDPLGPHEKLAELVLLRLDDLGLS